MGKRVIVGLDPSSRKIAMAISVDGGKPKLQTKTLGMHDLPRACYQAHRYVRSVVKQYTAQGHHVFLFIEGPVVGRGGVGSTLKQTKTNGAMQAGAVGGGASVTEVNNSTWKKQVVGSGRAGKPEIKKWIKDCWPYAYELADGDQDLMDACAILRYGEKIINTKDRIEEEMLEKASAKPVRKPVRKK